MQDRDATHSRIRDLGDKTSTSQHLQVSPVSAAPGAALLEPNPERSSSDRTVNYVREEERREEAVTFQSTTALSPSLVRQQPLRVIYGARSRSGDHFRRSQEQMASFTKDHDDDSDDDVPLSSGDNGRERVADIEDVPPALIRKCGTEAVVGSRGHDVDSRRVTAFSEESPRLGVSSSMLLGSSKEDISKSTASDSRTVDDGG